MARKEGSRYGSPTLKKKKKKNYEGAFKYNTDEFQLNKSWPDSRQCWLIKSTPTQKWTQIPDDNYLWRVDDKDGPFYYKKTILSG